MRQRQQQQEQLQQERQLERQNSEVSIIYNELEVYKLPNFFQFHEFNRNSYDHEAEVLLARNG